MRRGFCTSPRKLEELTDEQIDRIVNIVEDLLACPEPSSPASESKMEDLQHYTPAAPSLPPCEPPAIRDPPSEPTATRDPPSEHTETRDPPSEAPAAMDETASSGLVAARLAAIEASSPHAYRFQNFWQ
jgi:hypothetical protein